MCLEKPSCYRDQDPAMQRTEILKDGERDLQKQMESALAVHVPQNCCRGTRVKRAAVGC